MKNDYPLTITTAPDGEKFHDRTDSYHETMQRAYVVYERGSGSPWVADVWVSSDGGFERLAEIVALANTAASKLE